ncbi:unnamed protein product [Pleuronectes platessa]|uniref:Uncharacterized protein n=1 Tax=Pleuronectes platessa TaxID=8262 RepID=A0A9N7ZA61_PLEPL|nr:unnamed protein product [Pleuronectes platessa]
MVGKKEEKGALERRGDGGEERRDRNEGGGRGRSTEGEADARASDACAAAGHHSDHSTTSCSPGWKKVQTLKDEDSDDEPTVFSLPGVSPGESITLDEEIILDQIKDFEIEDNSTKPEVWQSEWHKKHMGAISSEKFDSLLKMFPEFHNSKSHMAAFVLIRGLMFNPGLFLCSPHLS